jgi:hypothetical protein
MRHDEPPVESDLPQEELEAEVERLAASAYAAQVKRLEPRVIGRVVASSPAGSSGYLLRFRDGSWVAA